ncbi:MAG: NAD-dependent epimerase/dehydratase family protein [Nitrospirota bacterium]|nr:NAD-dependent epimerase/dehydratase family protein [Nitrospirota bacterium]
MNTILLTGSTGFLGSHLLRRLIQESDTRVIIAKRSFSNVAKIADVLVHPQVIAIDVDTEDIEGIFKNEKIDLIIHTATEYGRSKKSIYSILESNLMFPIRIIELGIKYKVKSFINTDSYFNKEKYSYNYLLDYSLSKKSFLLWLKNFSQDIQVVNMMLEHVFGEYDNRSKFVEDVIRSIAIENVDEFDLTYGNQRRDFIYIDDVVNAYICVVKYLQNNSIQYKNFEVGRGESIEIKQFVDMVKYISSSTTRLNYGRIPYRLDEIMDSHAENKELLNIGWVPKVSVQDGLSHIILKYREKF